MKKLKQCEVINKFVKNWGDRYDYSLVKYHGMKSKIDIICTKHGVFSMNPNNHLNSQGCPKCGIDKKTHTQEEFIKIANEKHNNFYDYTSTDYKGFNEYITIVCPLHGEFNQIATNHLKHGCKICGGGDNYETFIKKCNEKWDYKYDYKNTIYNGSHEYIEYICPEHGSVRQLAYSHLKSCCPKCSRFKINKEIFLEKSHNIHNDKYDYSLINSVNGINDFVNIICKKHGVFKQKVDIHLKGYGCVKCYHDSMKFDSMKFLEKSNKIHDYLYDYSKVKYVDYNTKVKIICKKHGEFLQTPPIHLSGGGCPICKSSKGELKIHKYLDSLKIEYIKGKRFKGCKFKNELPFDFYIPSCNTIIEYDGEMHFKEIEKFGGKDKLDYYKNNDNIKNKFCKDNNIKLIRIKYTDFDKIHEIINEHLNN